MIGVKRVLSRITCLTRVLCVVWFSVDGRGLVRRCCVSRYGWETWSFRSRIRGVPENSPVRWVRRHVGDGVSHWRCGQDSWNSEIILYNYFDHVLDGDGPGFVLSFGCRAFSIFSKTLTFGKWPFWLAVRSWVEAKGVCVFNWRILGREVSGARWLERRRGMDDRIWIRERMCHEQRNYGEGLTGDVVKLRKGFWLQVMELALGVRQSFV